MKNPRQARWWRKLKADPVRLAAFYARRKQYLDRHFADPARKKRLDAYQARYRAENRERLRLESQRHYAAKKAEYLARQKRKYHALSPEEKRVKNRAHWQRAKARRTDREMAMARARSRRQWQKPAKRKALLAKHREWLAANAEHVRAYAKARRDEPGLYYIAHLLGLPMDEVPEPLYRLKRAHLQLRRELKQTQQTKCNH